MPIYEYRCRKCAKRFTTLTLRVSEAVKPKCEHCGSTSAQRLLSRFAMPKSEEARMAAAADPSNFGDIDESDPKSVARWMKRMGKEMGDEIGSDDVDAMVDQVESGGDDAGDE